MKKKYRLAALFLVLALLGGCGASKDATTYQNTSASAPAAAPEEEAVAYESSMAYDAGMKDEGAEYGEDAAAEGGVTSTSGIERVDGVSQKLIKTVGMRMETKEFDTLLEDIRKQVEELGGYVERSEISGSSYYSTRGSRNAWLNLRIPADKLDRFVTVVGELGNVTSKSESVEDITLQYVDVESHKKALETEQTRLLELLEKAESMEDIITIESRLSQVRYELQSYESTLRTYDNKVTYSTVSLDIYEVERVTEIPEEKSFFEEAFYRLSDNLYAISRDLRAFAIWLISSLPYLVLWAVVIGCFVLLFRRLVWKKRLFGKGKKNKKENFSEKDEKDS